MGVVPTPSRSSAILPDCLSITTIDSAVGTELCFNCVSPGFDNLGR